MILAPAYRRRTPRVPMGVRVARLPEPAEFVPARHREPRTWTAAESDLLRWFEANRDRTPRAPFTLSQGVEVTDRDLFLAGLARDVAQGSNGPRAGGLITDLADLRRVIDGEGRS